MAQVFAEQVLLLVVYFQLKKQSDRHAIVRGSGHSRLPRYLTTGRDFSLTTCWAEFTGCAHQRNGLLQRFNRFKHFIPICGWCKWPTKRHRTLENVCTEGSQRGCSNTNYLPRQAIGEKMWEYCMSISQRIAGVFSGPGFYSDSTRISNRVPTVIPLQSPAALQDKIR